MIQEMHRYTILAAASSNSVLSHFEHNSDQAFVYFSILFCRFIASGVFHDYIIYQCVETSFIHSFSHAPEYISNFWHMAFSSQHVHSPRPLIYFSLLLLRFRKTRYYDDDMAFANTIRIFSCRNTQKDIYFAAFLFRFIFLDIFDASHRPCSSRQHYISTILDGRALRRIAQQVASEVGLASISDIIYAQAYFTPSAISPASPHCSRRRQKYRLIYDFAFRLLLNNYYFIFSRLHYYIYFRNRVLDFAFRSLIATVSNALRISRMRESQFSCLSRLAISHHIQASLALVEEISE